MSTYYQQGAYKCEIVDQGLSQSSNGNPQIWLKIRALESIDDPALQIQQHERMVYWTITEKTIEFVLEKLDALGFDGESFRQIDLNNQHPQSFIGNVEEFYCQLETYDGKEREKWDLSRGASAVKPLDETEARKLDALFGRKLKDKFKSSSGPSRAAPNGTTSQKTEGVPREQTLAAHANSADDDIPF